ncbi:MAG: two-component system sensor histidine kinase NtrB, partial [Gemmatimonadales bacterium]
ADITERKTAERRQQRLQEAVMASAADWTLTFDAVQFPILILDRDSRVRRLNGAARTLSGKDSYQEAVGRTLAEFSTGEPWRSLSELAAEVRRTRTPSTGQVRGAGPRRSWYLNASPLTVTGEDDRVIVIARDVTDLVSLQDSLRRTETMSALGSLVAGVAHEVRNPLFAISATVDAFEARVGVKSAYARYTQTLREAVGRLSELMRELLDYGTPPRVELAIAPVDPAVRRAIAGCGVLAEASGVAIVCELPEDLPSVRLDASRIQQVFENLIGNAVQHSPRGETVVVSAAQVPGDPGPWIEVSVADRGPGFREQDLPRIFEPFFTRRRGGTGLGLSIVQRIVEQHSGEIVARNRPEGGAVTTVRLAVVYDPARPAAETARAQA